MLHPVSFLKIIMMLQAFLLARLIAAENPIGGQYLADELEVSRSAVWKQIEFMRTCGLIITSDRRGYRMEEWTEALQLLRLQRFLHISAPQYADHVMLADSLDSTNSEAKRLAADAWPDRSLVLSRRQTMGRGRQGRTWSSDDSGGLYLSILLRPELSPQALMPLTLLSALALREALSEFLPEAVGLKWPNDIIYQGRKLCGILCESVLEDAGIRQLVIGIGLNINQKTFSESLADKAISIRQITGLDYDPNYIAARVVFYFEEYYQRFLSSGQSFDPFIGEYRRACITLDQTVMLLQGDESYQAQAISVTREGYLVLRLDSGKELVVGSGEVSVRGLLGYA